MPTHAVPTRTEALPATPEKPATGTPGDPVSKDRHAGDAAAQRGHDDPLRDAYAAFAMAAFAEAHGRFDQAARHIEEALEHDRDSAYLNLKMALLLKEMNHPQEALGYAQKASEAAPGLTEPLILLGDLYRMLEDEKRAAEAYEKILQADPRNQRVRFLLATLFIRTGQYSRALDHLDLLLAEKPDLILAHYYKGRVYLEMEDFQGAEDAFQNALQFNEIFEPALFDLGTLYQMTGRDVQAASMYETLLSVYPENSSARERLANLYFKLGLNEKAEQQLEQIKAHSEPGELGRQSLGLIYLKQGRLDESIEELKMILLAWPDDDKTAYYLATAYEERGDFEEAEKYFSRIKPQSTYYTNARLHMAFAMENGGDYLKAADLLRDALQHTAQPELYIMLSTVLEKGGQIHEAEQAVREGLKQSPEHIDLIYRLGVLLDQQGDKAACIAEMQRILRIEPEHADALNYIGYSYAEQGIRLDEALKLVQKALEIKPESGYIIDSLGWVYFQKGLYETAIQHLQRAAELEPNDPTIHEHLGDAYFRKRLYAEALERYEKALSLSPTKKRGLEEKIVQTKDLLGKEE